MHGEFIFGFITRSQAFPPTTVTLLTRRSFTKILMNNKSNPSDGRTLARPDDGANGNFYTSHRLSPHFGIEAAGVDLNDASLIDNSEFISQMKRDLVRHRAILFRSQNLSGQRQVEISDRLGTIQSTFYKHPKSPHPDIFRVSNDEDEGCTRVGRSGWHLDGTFQERPFMYQTMYFPSVAEGGDTYFVPLKELYDSFSAREKEYYNKLWMVTGRREAPIHPLVYKHPFRPNDEETLLFHCGRPFVNGWFCDEAHNMTDGGNVVNGVDTSKMIHPSVIQDQLTKNIESELSTIGIRMKWQRGDFFITDNLGLAHYASEGTQGCTEDVGLRILHRTTVVGGEETVPSKLDGRRSFMMG